MTTETEAKTGFLMESVCAFPKRFQVFAPLISTTFNEFRAKGSNIKCTGKLAK